MGRALSDTCTAPANPPASTQPRVPPPALVGVQASGSEEQKARLRRILAETHAGLGQWREAYLAHREFDALEATRQQRVRAEQAARLRLDFDRERAAAEVQALQQINEQGQRLQRLQRLQAVAILLCAVLLLAALLFVLLQFRQIHRVRKLALTDELTALPNRRAIMSTAVEVLAQAGAAPVSLLMLDLDRFKTINDRFGHDEGDRVLCRVSELLDRTLDGRGRIGRFGGEEFLVVLPGTGSEAATEIAETLRHTVASHIQVGDGAERQKATISIGAATCSGPADSLQALLVRADTALYQAKHRGRDRVVFCPAFAA